jgi:hypothetical protein
MLKDKKILFIAPEYFNYSALIRTCLISSGAEVDLYHNQPVNLAARLSSHISQDLFKWLEERYFSRLKKRITGSYDYVLIIRPDVLSKEFLGCLRLAYPRSVFIQYLWDDIRFFPALTDTFSYFDRVLSYDIHDCNKYGLVFRPFFFVPEAGTVKTSKKFDLFFIGIYQKDRLKVLEKVRELNPGINFHPHFYINPITFLKAGFLFKKWKLFSFKKMNYRKMIRMVKSSSAILDIPKPSQKGLTTRIFEAMGAGVKIITTNENVRNYDFFNERNFLVVDRHNPVIDPLWINGSYENYEVMILKKYYISRWIEDVFDIESNTNTNN